MNELASIAAAIYMEALYQEGLKTYGLPDTETYREAFLAMFTEDLITGFLQSIDFQIEEGLMVAEDGEDLKDTLRTAMEEALGGDLDASDLIPFSTKGRSNNPNKKGGRGEMVGRSNPNEKKESEEEGGRVLKDETEGVDLPPPSSLFSSEDYLN